MSGTNELSALLRACEALDNPHIASEQVESIRQLAQVLALSFDAGLPVEGDAPEWPDPARRISYVLALKTMLFAASRSWPESSDWWIAYRERMRTEWLDARRAAESLLSGAEPVAETRTDDVSTDATIPPLVSRSDLPAAVTRCGDAIAWTID